MTLSKLAFVIPLFTLLTSCSTLRVMSYNISQGNSPDGANSWPYRRAATQKMLSYRHPDICGLQEAYDYQIEYVTTQCPKYKSIGVGREDGKKSGEHMSILYNQKRLNVVDWGTFWLSETPDTPSVGWDARCKRTATWAIFEYNNSKERIFVLNTHLDHVGKQARQKGLQLILQFIEQKNSEQLPVFVCGDFNISALDTILSDINQHMKSARFTAQRRDKLGSFNGFGLYRIPTRQMEIGTPTLLPIDHIYYRGTRRCRTFRVDTRTYQFIPYISDHYPIFSDFIL